MTLLDLTPFLVLFYGLIAVGVVVAAGFAADFVARNRSQRLRLRMPVVSYYRHVAFSH